MIPSSLSIPSHPFITLLYLIIITIFIITTRLSFRLLYRLYKSRISSPLTTLPGPTPTSLLFGCSPEILREPYMAPHLRWWKSSGYDTPLIYYITFFGRQNLLVLDPSIAKTILSSGRHRFGRRREFLKKSVGRSLLTLEGDDWYRHRMIIQPSFRVSDLKESLGAAAECLMPKLLQAWEVVADGSQKGEKEGRMVMGVEIDVAYHLSAITLDVIGKVGFSHDFDALEDVDQWCRRRRRRWEINKEGEVEVEVEEDNESPGLSNPLIKSITEMLTPRPSRIVADVLGLDYIYKLLDVPYRRMAQCLNAEVDKVIHRARKGSLTNNDTNNDGTTNTSTTPKKSKSILNLLWDAHDTDNDNDTTMDSHRTLNDVELRDEIKGFILAGHETTSTWCYWCLYVLSQFPDVQQRVYDDVIQRAPLENNNTDQKGAISLDVIENMAYFNAFLKEVIRLYPPAGFTLVHPNNDEIIDGHVIPKDTRIMIPIFLLHRHPHYWNEDPELFKPERWLVQGSGEETKPYKHPMAYCPFSAGSRVCIGYQFAIIEVKLIMAPLVRAFRFSPAPSQRDVKFELTSHVTMKTKPGLKVTLSSRSRDG